MDVAAELKAWLEPLLAEADYMAAGIDGGVRLIGEDAERGDVDLIIDFVAREVRPYADEKVRYQWRTARALLEAQVAAHEIDWSNSLFLSCRFTATRIGQYNEFVYTFFKCLSDERINYVEGWYLESDAATAAETTVLDGWEVQRRCPHLKADLARFGQVDDGVLTCQMHGWKWRLSDGKCLTSVGRDIRSQHLGRDAAALDGYRAHPGRHHSGRGRRDCRCRERAAGRWRRRRCGDSSRGWSAVAGRVAPAGAVRDRGRGRHAGVRSRPVRPLCGSCGRAALRRGRTRG